MKTIRDYSILLLIMLTLVACPRPAREVAIDINAQIESQERVKLLAQAQFDREQLIDLAETQEERNQRTEIAKNSEKQILASLTAQERSLFKTQMRQHRSALKSFDQLLNPAQTAFYQDLPTIKGVTVDQPSHFFNLDLIIAYDANDRRLGNDISSARLPIVDALRNLLMQYPLAPSPKAAKSSYANPCNRPSTKRSNVSVAKARSTISLSLA